MVKGELQFIEDTKLINKLAIIEFSVQKTAGFGDVLLGKLGDGLNVIKEEVFDLVDTSSTGSAIESVGNIIATGALFKMWAPLAVINAVADQIYGINIITIGKKIWDLILPTIKSTGTISPQEITNATKSVTLAMAGPEDISLVKDVKAFDLFEPLRYADSNGKLFSFAASGRRSGGVMGFLSSISPFKGKTIIGGLAGWAIKSALIGAGILAVSGVGARLLGLKKTPEEDAKDESGDTVNTMYFKSKDEVEKIEEQKVNLTSTGRGQEIHQNDHKNSKWIVPLVQNSVEKTLVVWAEDVYDELEGKELLIRKSPYFNKVVSEIKQFLEPGNSSRVPMPPKYKSRKQVVDQFAGDIENKLSEMI